eukprot:Opistho-1_new@72863
MRVLDGRRCARRRRRLKGQDLLVDDQLGALEDELVHDLLLALNGLTHDIAQRIDRLHLAAIAFAKPVVHHFERLLRHCLELRENGKRAHANELQPQLHASRLVLDRAVPLRERPVHHALPLGVIVIGALALALALRDGRNGRNSRSARELVPRRGRVRRSGRVQHHGRRSDRAHVDHRLLTRTHVHHRLLAVASRRRGRRCGRCSSRRRRRRVLLRKLLLVANLHLGYRGHGSRERVKHELAVGVRQALRRAGSRGRSSSGSSGSSSSSSVVRIAAGVALLGGLHGLRLVRHAAHERQLASTRGIRRPEALRTRRRRRADAMPRRTQRARRALLARLRGPLGGREVDHCDEHAGNGILDEAVLGHRAVVVVEELARVLEAVHFDLHEADVEVREDADVVLEPPLLHDGVALLLGLILALVANVPQRLAEVVHAAVQLRLRLGVVANVLVDGVVRALPACNQLLLAVGAAQERQKVLLRVEKVPQNALALLAQHAEHVARRRHVVAFDELPLRREQPGELLVDGKIRKSPPARPPPRHRHSREHRQPSLDPGWLRR